MRSVFVALRNISWGASVLLLAACARAPEPFDADELSQRARSDFDQLQQIDPQAQAPVSLYDAIARALKYNRERDKFAASASTTFSGDTPAPLSANPVYTVAQDKERTTRSVAFSWNILDFGLSYVRAGQQSDRYLIAREKIRKMQPNIVRDVRVAYWRAVAAQNVGAQGATVTYARGTGLRERMGLLGVTIDEQKEMIRIIVSEEQADRVFEAMYLAGQLDSPGMGVMFMNDLTRVATYIPDDVLEAAQKSESDGGART